MRHSIQTQADSSTCQARRSGPLGTAERIPPLRHSYITGWLMLVQRSWTTFENPVRFRDIEIKVRFLTLIFL